MNKRSLLLFVGIFFIILSVLLYVVWSAGLLTKVDGSQIIPYVSSLTPIFTIVGAILAVCKFLLDYTDRSTIEFERFYSQNNTYFIKVRKKSGKEEVECDGLIATKDSNMNVISERNSVWVTSILLDAKKQGRWRDKLGSYYLLLFEIKDESIVFPIASRGAARLGIDSYTDDIRVYEEYKNQKLMIKVSPIKGAKDISRSDKTIQEIVDTANK